MHKKVNDEKTVTGKSKRLKLYREQVMVEILQAKPLKIIHELLPENYD